jgi:hypothetical protein
LGSGKKPARKEQMGQQVSKDQAPGPFGDASITPSGQLRDSSDHTEAVLAFRAHAPPHGGYRDADAPALRGVFSLRGRLA